MTVNIRKCKKERTQQICWKVQGFQSSLWTGRNIKLFQTFREDRLASHFFSDVFPLKEFTTMGLMYLLEVPSLEEILNLGIHQIAAVLEQIPFPLYRICWRPCYVDSDCMRWEVGGGGGRRGESLKRHANTSYLWEFGGASGNHPPSDVCIKFFVITCNHERLSSFAIFVQPVRYFTESTCG